MLVYYKFSQAFVNRRPAKDPNYYSLWLTLLQASNQIASDIVFTLNILGGAIRKSGFQHKNLEFSKAHYGFEAGWDFRGVIQRALVFYYDLLTSNVHLISTREVSDIIIHITHNDKQTNRNMARIYLNLNTTPRRKAT